MDLSGEERGEMFLRVERRASLPDHADAGFDPGPGSGRSDLGKPAAMFAKAAAPARYLECLRNHAASVGGNVLDGCREFMQSGDDGSADALKCAACSCHRNFHRKAFDDGEPRFQLLPLQPPPPLRSQILPQPHKAQPSYPFGGGASAGAESSSEDMNAAAPPQAPVATAGRKRFRTKFTAEQKERMAEFAERMGWRIQSRNEAEIQRFCAEVGVRRQVFKVWMHNNKNSANQHRHQQQPQHPPQTL